MSLALIRNLKPNAHSNQLVAHFDSAELTARFAWTESASNKPVLRPVVGSIENLCALVLFVSAVGDVWPHSGEQGDFLGGGHWLEIPADADVLLKHLHRVDADDE